MASQKLVIASNTIFQIIGRFISSGATFLTTILLAKSLGAQGYGDFSKITTFVAFFYLVTDLGMNASFLRLQEGKKELTWNHLFGARIILAIVSIFLCISILSFLPHGQSQGYTPFVRFGIIFYSLSILCHAGITTANALFQQKLAYHRSTIALGIGSAVTIAIAFLFVGNSTLAAAVALLIGLFVTMIVSFLLVRPFISSYSPSWSSPILKLLFADALPLSVTLIFNLIYFRVDSVILTLTQPTVDVGIYNLAYKFFEFPLVIPLFFMNALYPLLLKRKHSSEHEFKTTLFFACKCLFGLSILTAIVCWIGAPLVGTINPSFIPVIPIFRTFALSLPIFFLTSLTMWALITQKNNLGLVVIYGVSMLGNLIANILLVPQYGYWASTWITIGGETVILFLSTIVVLQKLKNTQDKSIPKIL